MANTFECIYNSKHFFKIQSTHRIFAALIDTRGLCIYLVIFEGDAY